ncbi:hypothetical protein GOP47_0009647 [Adiantum capillus-veneris]|uniref:Uncharacterized protein n=1 Tax=Adiantum capillus-veneris TaxID=13818 RepID=A0A9D4UX10_ADICA|nr:hypothetical protein GOP47_0009647 [Adiantum capillus-veneris]
MAADRSRSPCSISRSSSFTFDYVKGWKSCWGGWGCFTPRRRLKYHSAESSCLVPQPILGEISAANGSLTLDMLNQVAFLPPVMSAPPPSPLSFGATLDSTSSQLSTANLFSLFPEHAERVGNHYGLPFDANKSESHVGLFVLDDALATPPIHSTLTTATATPLSTAPFTPPPELAHLTTPSSPEVPFAHLLETSVTEFRSSLSQKVEHLSLHTFPAAQFQLTHRLYPCSPIGQLVTFNSGASSPQALSPMREGFSFEKGTSCTNVVTNCFLSALEDSSLEDSGLTTSESVCNTPISLKQGQQKGHAGSTIVADVFEQEDPKSSPFALHTCSKRFGHKRQESEECCPRCGELSAKCRDLSEALEQTREKLTLVETKVNSIDQRERKFKQLMQWMQLSVS